MSNLFYQVHMSQGVFLLHGIAYTTCWIYHIFGFLSHALLQLLKALHIIKLRFLNFLLCDYFLTLNMIPDKLCEPRKKKLKTVF
jgi:hypothetical protein